MLKNTYNLEGKTVLIIGGLGWLGSEYTKECVNAGANVIVFDRFALKDWRSKIGENAYKKIIFERFNGYDQEKFRNKILKAVETSGKIDCLVNSAFDFSKNTGFHQDTNSFEKSTIQTWRNTFESGMVWHLISTQIILSQADISNIKIVNIASMYGVVAPNPDNYNDSNAFMLPQYGMAKAGIINLTKYIASYYGKWGVCCNAIAPGAFPKDEVISDSFRKNLIGNIPLRRLGRPTDLAGLMMFLLSEDSSYITGQVFLVDGGWTIR